MGKARVIIAICILIVGFLGYLIGKQSTRIPSATNITQLNLPYEQVKVRGVDNAQQKQIEDFVVAFYEYQQQKEVDRLLALFTPPTNNKEQADYDFLLGKDLARTSAKPQTRLFASQGYNYTVGGYYIRDITRHNDTTTVLVDEMRIIYSGGEYVGYSANITNLTLEIMQTQNGVKIVSYAHKSKTGKYEGLNGY